MSDRRDLADRWTTLARLSALDTRDAPPAVVVAHVVLLMGEILGADPRRIGTWLTTPHPGLEGSTPLAVIEAGEGGAVVTLIESQLAGALS